jgi:hypothetical protein
VDISATFLRYEVLTVIVGFNELDYIQKSNRGWSLGELIRLVFDLRFSQRYSPLKVNGLYGGIPQKI